MFKLDARRSPARLTWWSPIHLRTPLAPSDAPLRELLRSRVAVTEGPEWPQGGHTLVSDEVTEDELREAFKRSQALLSVGQLREALKDDAAERTAKAKAQAERSRRAADEVRAGVRTLQQQINSNAPGGAGAGAGGAGTSPGGSPRP